MFGVRLSILSLLNVEGLNNDNVNAIIGLIKIILIRLMEPT